MGKSGLDPAWAPCNVSTAVKPSHAALIYFCSSNRVDPPQSLQNPQLIRLSTGAFWEVHLSFSVKYNRFMSWVFCL